MSDSIITITGVSKQYKMFAYKRHRILDLLGFSVAKKNYDEFWALRDINFTVSRGARIGIIGHNGAGKSTLLKIIAGQISPTGGEVTVHGKIQALMELGTGFYAEFSGRENIYSALGYQGVTGKLAKQKYSEILEFSELEEFIENPVKTYSAGMYARLTFSVATAIRPEILIIDEILGAGDAYFSGKCVGRMKELTSKGTTVLFVSHDMSSVQQLCDEAIWMERGKIIATGDTLKISKKYLKNVRNREEKRLRQKNKQIVADIGNSNEAKEGIENLLFHFIADEWRAPVQEHPINCISLETKNRNLGEIQIGNAADNDAEWPNHIVVQRNLMEWGDSTSIEGKYCRCFKHVGGKYLHAPFQFEIEADEVRISELIVKIDYFDSGDEEFHVEIFLDDNYQKIGTVFPEGENIWKQCSFSLSNVTDARTRQQIETIKPVVSDDECYGSGEVRMKSFSFFDSKGKKRHTLISGEKATAEMTLITDSSVADPVAVIAIYRLDGICVLQVISSRDDFLLGKINKIATLTIQFDPLLLGPGEYIVSLALFKEFNLLTSAEPAAYDLHDRCYPLKVLPPEGINVEIGIVNQKAKWTLTT